MSAEKIIFSIFVPAVIAALGAMIVYLFGEKAGLIDMPSERSSHFRPTPRGGGVGIWIALVLMSFIVFRHPVPVLLAVSIGFLGLLDDVFHVSPKMRLLFQFILAINAVLLLLYIPGPIVGKAFLTFFWIILVVWTTNLYNFMDGIDGIAGLTGTVGFSFLAYYAFFVADNPYITAICVAMSAASLGFLFFNFPKAKVFMGDVGSVSLGFVFAVIVMRLSGTVLDFLCLVSFMFTFYADELVTMVLRIKHGENLFNAHRSHFYQILVNEMKIPHWKVSIMYAAGQIIVAVCVLYVRKFGPIGVLCVLWLFLGGFITLNYAVRKKISLGVFKIQAVAK